MNWYMIVFVRMKDQAGRPLRWSKGKIAGQVGHACFRMASNVPKRVVNEYLAEGEKKLVYKVNDFPTTVRGIIYRMDEIVNDTDMYYDMNGNHVQFVTDLTSGEDSVMAILTREYTDERYSLL